MRTAKAYRVTIIPRVQVCGKTFLAKQPVVLIAYGDSPIAARDNLPVGATGVDFLTWSIDEIDAESV